MSTSKSSQTFDLSEQDVQEAISEWIEKKYGKGKPIKVTVSARMESRGYGPNEHDEAVAEVKATREL